MPHDPADELRFVDGPRLELDQLLSQLVGRAEDVMASQERLRGLLERCTTVADYEHALAELLGSAWDAELEPYRIGGDGAPVTLLHQVG